jgi:1-deoxy-D-xylulose-5-phosphate synthase
MLADLAGRYGHLVTLEENVLHGGFGSAVSEWHTSRGQPSPRLYHRGVPDRFVTHGARGKLLAEVGLDAASTHAFVADLLAAATEST